MQVGHRTDPGLERPANEDAYLVMHSRPWRVLAVADGMGGHAGGEVASSAAVNSLQREIEAAARIGALPDLDNASQFFSNLLHQANATVWLMSRESGLQGMGTTLTVLFSYGLQAVVGHIGDSRLYLIRNHRIELLSRDHSLVEEMVQNGQLPQAEAATHPQKHVLTRALGTQEWVQFDLFTLSLMAGDIVVLCSDGLSNMVTAEDILNLTLGASHMQQAADRLVQAANANGGSDNITVVVAEFEAGDEVV